jgi:hypothetical protein
MIEILESDGLLESPLAGEADLVGIGWRLAKSLVVLREECNALAPNRSKIYDGTIGDAAHAARASRHNPNDAGVVCALDTTQDPVNGFDAHKIAREHVKNPNPDLAYVISAGQVARRSNGWKWVTYTGTNKHTTHVHWAVGTGYDSEPKPPYDDTVSWGIKAVPFVPVLKQNLEVTKPHMTNNNVVQTQNQLLKKGYSVGKHGADGIYGIDTENAVKKFQTAVFGVGSKEIDGIVGPKTWSKLWL